MARLTVGLETRLRGKLYSGYRSQVGVRSFALAWAYLVLLLHQYRNERTIIVSEVDRCCVQIRFYNQILESITLYDRKEKQTRKEEQVRTTQ